MKYTININQYAAIASELDLDLIDLAIFDFIKDFANTSHCIKMQTPQGVFFWISHSLIIKEMPLLGIKTKQGIIKRVDNLVAAGVLMKHPNCEMYGKTLYCFGAKYDVLTFTNETNMGSTSVDTPKQLFTPPLNESLGYNINNIDNNITYKASAKDLPEAETKKTLFSNSDIFKLVKTDKYGKADYSAFESLFDKPEFKTIDLVYYFHTVSDWSDQSGTKRNKRGWIATVRNFIRRDIEKGKLKLKPEHQTKQQQLNIAGAMEFLNDY